MFKIIKDIFQHKCLYRSLLLYWICRFFDRKAAYQINIMMRCFQKDAGHAWVTRNGKIFYMHKYKLCPFVLEKIGENNKYVFWLAT